MKVHSKDKTKTYEYDYKMIFVREKIKDELKNYCKERGVTYTQAITNWLKKDNVETKILK